ncbi:MAG TPA: serine/threonine-protein kinase, partial [Verrucomicrobiales bacterium]|nr:serine/threonine-protein kinase [Verrucomicrobiales bacterium]
MIPPPVVSCPRCRAALPEGVLHGLCPACLIDAAGMDSEAGTAADPFGAPLDLETLRRSFPQFEILAPIGAGGMGRVYKVRQPNLDRIVALKILPPELARNPAWVERFTREARALARLNHPHIVQVYDVGQTTGEPPLCWLIMEFVDGVTLRQVQRTGGLSAREALTIIPRLCDALQYAHEKGVLHRDIKPENILLDASGAVKIADFGLAKLGGANSPCTLTQAGARLGTAAYMAPEQIETPQDVDHRADIYSLGVVFYELLTGGLPLGRFPAPSEKSGVDPRLDHIVFRTLEKERTRRFQAAGEVRTALDRVAAGPVTPPPIPPGAARGSSVPVQPAGSPVPAQIRQTNPELPGSVKVGFRDRNRRFPGSSWEAAGYGCGWAICAPVRVAAFLAAWLLPLGVRNFLARGRYEEFTNGLETYASWAVWIAAATGLISYFAVRSVAAIPAGSRKIQNPLILVLCLLVWCFTLTYIAVESR